MNPQETEGLHGSPSNAPRAAPDPESEPPTASPPQPEPVSRAEGIEMGNRDTTVGGAADIPHKPWNEALVGQRGHGQSTSGRASTSGPPDYDTRAHTAPLYAPDGQIHPPHGRTNSGDIAQQDNAPINSTSFGELQSNNPFRPQVQQNTQHQNSIVNHNGVTPHHNTADSIQVQGIHHLSPRRTAARLATPAAALPSPAPCQRNEESTPQTRAPRMDEPQAIGAQTITPEEQRRRFQANDLPGQFTQAGGFPPGAEAVEPPTPHPTYDPMYVEETQNGKQRMTSEPSAGPSLLDGTAEDLGRAHIPNRDMAGPQKILSQLEEKPLPPTPKSEATDSENTPLQEKPSEIYDIRIVNWMDGSHKYLRQSPVLVQNENGPCPLLALVNSLVLRTPPEVHSPLIKALFPRERISLGLLIQSLFDELTTYVSEERQLPDIEALSSFLTMLHTGMNVNPRLTPDTNPDRPGMFHATRDIELYSAFNLPLVHGWLATPDSEPHKAMTRTAEYHDDIQLLHFRKEELEEKALRGNLLTPDEEQLVYDIDYIQRFVVENTTQLSPFGLDLLKRSLDPGSVCILFRNDHFSTLFKHPQTNQLYTLVTDAGYASYAEIVWESLVDVSGSATGFFSGDFRSVGNAPSSPPANDDRTGDDDQNAGSTGKTTEDTEQMDADYAFALALQYQDEEEQQTRSHHRSTSGPFDQPRQQQQQQQQREYQPYRPPAPPTRTNRHHPTGLRTAQPQPQPQSRPQRQTVRSLIPPAHEQTVTPARHAHGQSHDETTDAPPPPYEQASLAPEYDPSPAELEAQHHQRLQQRQQPSTHHHPNSIPTPRRKSSPIRSLDLSGPRMGSFNFSSYHGDDGPPPPQPPLLASRRRQQQQQQQQQAQAQSSYDAPLPERPPKDGNKDCRVM